MSPACSYSFSDLYSAAFGRKPSLHELERLYALPQEERNRIVREWAVKAGWVTENVRDAIEIVQPYGVDVCSGVRTGGKLDREKLVRFVGR